MANKIKNFGIEHWPLFAAAGIFLAVLFVLVFFSLRATQGHFAYALDDIYIHMAIAKNFAEHGVWGITKTEFASAASSIIYPLILTASFIIFGVNELSPFIVNIFFGLLAILAAYAILKNYGLKNRWTAVSLLIFVFVTPLFVVTLTGLEHTMHIAISLVFAYHAAKVIAADKPKNKELIWLILLSPILASVRFESMFLIFAACGLLFLKKRRGFSLLLGGLGVLPILTFGLISLSKGWYFFPNSILLKSKFEHFVLWDTLKLGYFGLKNLTEPHILLLIVGALIFFALAARKQETLRDSKQIMIILFVIATLLHLTLAQTGWLYRYEAYLVAMGIITISIGSKEYLRENNFSFFPKEENVKNYSISLILIFFVISLPFFFRAAGSLAVTPSAIKNFYEQDYQMGLFVKKYYNRGRVAVNDIGAVSFLPDAETIVDVVGLGNFDVAKAKRTGKFTREWLDAYTQEKKVKIAIVHDTWFIDLGIPSRWKKVGSWTVGRNATSEARTITFYAVQESETANLKRYFKEFSKSELPKTVTVREDF